MTDRQGKTKPRARRQRAAADQINGGSASAASTYEVGYRKPPRHTQFQKGQPRPPRKPRPEVEPSFEDWFEEELRLPMKFVDETGKEQVMPKGKVLAKATVNKALRGGDIRQIKDFIPRRPAKTDNEVSKADLEMVARFFANRFGVDVDFPMSVSGEEEDKVDETWPEDDEEDGQ
ncbi:hypothetical protein ACWPM1_13850 [Tsuneonella sp. HG249]